MCKWVCWARCWRCAGCLWGSLPFAPPIKIPGPRNSAANFFARRVINAVAAEESVLVFANRADLALAGVAVGRARARLRRRTFRGLASANGWIASIFAISVLYDALAVKVASALHRPLDSSPLAYIRLDARAFKQRPHIFAHAALPVDDLQRQPNGAGVAVGSALALGAKVCLLAGARDGITLFCFCSRLFLCSWRGGSLFRRAPAAHAAGIVGSHAIAVGIVTECSIQHRIVGYKRHQCGECRGGLAIDSTETFRLARRLERAELVGSARVVVLRLPPFSADASRCPCGGFGGWVRRWYQATAVKISAASNRTAFLLARSSADAVSVQQRLFVLAGIAFSCPFGPTEIAIETVAPTRTPGVGICSVPVRPFASAVSAFLG